MFCKLWLSCVNMAVLSYAFLLLKRIAIFMTKQEQDTVTFFFFFFVFVLFYFSLYFYNCVPRRKKIVAVNRNFATEDAVGFFSVAFASRPAFVSSPFSSPFFL